MSDYHIPFKWINLSKEEIIKNLLFELQARDEELKGLYNYLENLPVDLSEIIDSNK